jgi:hypothetical protein
MLRRPRPAVDRAAPLLRRRTAHLLRDAPPRFRALVRALPMLLSTRLRRPSFEAEPPGLVRGPRRRRWGRLCEQLELPPPTSWFPVRPLVQGVVLAPTSRGTFELLVLPVEGLTRSELLRVSARVEAIAQLAERHAPTLEVRMASTAELTPSLFAWAALVAGDLPPGLMLDDDPTGLDWLDVFARAPGELARCLTLLVPPESSPPLHLARAGHLDAHPLSFLARWSGSPVPTALRGALHRQLTPGQFEGLVASFRGECLRALQRWPLPERGLLRRLVREPLLGRRVPRVLREPFERLLAEAGAEEVRGPDGWRLEVGGVVIARARSLDQLRAFGLAESPTLLPREGFWGRVKNAMAAGGARALAVIEPSFLLHLVVLIPRGGRPRARRVDAAGLLRLVLGRHRRGMPVELVPTMGCEATLLARAAQLLRLRLAPAEHVAFQVGRQVLVLSDERTRVLPLERAFARPRAVTWLPEQAEHLRALRPPRPVAGGLPTVHVVALPDGEGSAAVFALDTEGRVFRETVPREALEATLNEYRDVLRHAAPPVLMSATVHPLLTSLDGRRPEQHTSVSFDVETGPGGDRAVLDDERFGSRAPLSWGALGEAVLSRWPPGVWARVSVRRVAAPPGSFALSLLAARSRVLRRLATHLRRIARAMRAA